MLSEIWHGCGWASQRVHSTSMSVASAGLSFGFSRRSCRLSTVVGLWHCFGEGCQFVSVRCRCACLYPGAPGCPSTKEIPSRRRRSASQYQPSVHSTPVPARRESERGFIRKERAHRSELATICDQDAMKDAAAPRDFRRHHSGVRGGTKDDLRRTSPTGGRMPLRRTLDLDIPCQVASQQSPTPFLQANRDYPMDARSASILRTPESCLQNPRGSRGLVPQKRQEMLLRRHAHAQTG